MSGRHARITTERDTARPRGKYEGIRPHQYTPEALERIAADYEREEIRGAVPRCWEDVSIGEELRPIVKGPLTITDIIAWLRGWGGCSFVLIRSHWIIIDAIRRQRSTRRRWLLSTPRRAGAPF
jgi:hypothetical protein